MDMCLLLCVYSHHMCLSLCVSYRRMSTCVSDYVYTYRGMRTCVYYYVCHIEEWVHIEEGVHVSLTMCIHIEE